MAWPCQAPSRSTLTFLPSLPGAIASRSWVRNNPNPPYFLVCCCLGLFCLQSVLFARFAVAMRNDVNFCGSAPSHMPSIDLKIPLERSRSWNQALLSLWSFSPPSCNQAVPHACRTTQIIREVWCADLGSPPGQIVRVCSGDGYHTEVARAVLHKGLPADDFPGDFFKSDSDIFQFYYKVRWW